MAYDERAMKALQKKGENKMKKFVCIILVAIFSIFAMAAVGEEMATHYAYEYESLYDYIGENGCTISVHERLNLNEMIERDGIDAAVNYVKKMFNIDAGEDAMILDLEYGLAGVVFPVQDKGLTNMCKRIIRVELVLWSN
jgi:hypothetical protein